MSNNSGISLIAFGVLLLISVFIAILYYAGVAAAVYLVLKAVGAPLP